MLMFHSWRIPEFQSGRKIFTFVHCIGLDVLNEAAAGRKDNILDTARETCLLRESSRPSQLAGDSQPRMLIIEHSVHSGSDQWKISVGRIIIYWAKYCSHNFHYPVFDRSNWPLMTIQSQCTPMWLLAINLSIIGLKPIGTLCRLTFSLMGWYKVYFWFLIIIDLITCNYLFL